MKVQYTILHHAQHGARKSIESVKQISTRINRGFRKKAISPRRDELAMNGGQIET